MSVSPDLFRWLETEEMLGWASPATIAINVVGVGVANYLIGKIGPLINGLVIERT